MGVSASTEWTYRYIQTIILENEYLRLIILPELGAKLWKLIYQPKDSDMLWQHPRMKLRKLPFHSPQDHTGGTSPGFPTPRTEVADNDLALGRIVGTISHSSYWKDSAIFVVEDDAQNGVDLVDGHRTTGFVISPYVKRRIVASPTIHRST